MTQNFSRFPARGVVVNKKAAFLLHMMQELAGEDACISLEGDLTKCSFPEWLAAPPSLHGQLRRNTILTRQDYVRLRLTKENVDPIFTQVLVAGLKRAILHIEIARQGAIQVGIYDNFDPDCVCVGDALSRGFLSQLKDDRIVRAFDTLPDDKRDELATE